MEIIKTIFFALLIALVLRVVLFQPFTIPSASMEPNLYEGDYIVVSKWSYGYSKHSIPFSPPVFNGRIMLPGVSEEPRRGDIVVFNLPRDHKTDYIKRLIGLPGDRIQMINNVLFINGAAVPDVELSREDVQTLYGTQQTIKLRETLPEGREINIQDWGPGNISDDTPMFEVPAGHYFMIGDNRDNSQDSRYDQSVGVGFVPAENLIGKAEIIDDPERMFELGISVFDRYMAPYTEEMKGAVEMMLHKRVVVKLNVERTISWDHRKLGGGY
jgi:signal peptidase I